MAWVQPIAGVGWGGGCTWQFCEERIILLARILLASSYLENGLEVQPPVSQSKKDKQHLFLSQVLTSLQRRQWGKETCSKFIN